ncbi:MAG: hypothetical protein RJB58_1913 [Pseudomonadota bacterium]|jgi:hypothetical protein
MSGVMKMVYFPKIKLQEMLLRPGGIARDEAIHTAIENLRAESGESNKVIEDAIAAIAGIAAGAKANMLPQADMKAIMEQADQIVTVAGTFGYEYLDRAARGLCDITDGLIRTGCGDAAPIHVHVMALRLFSPMAAAPSVAEAEKVLSELASVKAFYGFTPIDAQVN